MEERVDSSAHHAHPSQLAAPLMWQCAFTVAPSSRQHLTRPSRCCRCAAACRAWTSPARPAPPSTCASTTSAACWTLRITWPAGRCVASLLPVWQVRFIVWRSQLLWRPCAPPQDQNSCGSNPPLLPILCVQFQRDLAAGCAPESEFLTGVQMTQLVWV